MLVKLDFVKNQRTRSIMCHAFIFYGSGFDEPEIECCKIKAKFSVNGSGDAKKRNRSPTAMCSQQLYRTRETSAEFSCSFKRFSCFLLREQRKNSHFSMSTNNCKSSLINYE